jgi:hypothetical protein
VTIQPLVIKSEEEAWKILSEALEGKRFPEGTFITFSGWPRFDIRVEGSDWHQSVPTRVMPSLMELQKDIWRSYAQMRFGHSNLRHLSEEDKERLEIVVKVNEGSSWYTALLDGPLSKAAASVVDKMTPEELIISVLGVAVVWGGTQIFREWFKSQVEKKRIDGQIELSKQETERAKVIAKAADASSSVETAILGAERLAVNVIKSLKTDDRVNLPGVPLAAPEGRELVAHERNVAEEIRIDGPFRIEQVNAGGTADFRIKVWRVGDELTFAASVPLGLRADQRELIKNAEWNRSFVQLAINARKVGDRIVDARVISAAEPTQQDYENAKPHA